MKKLLEIALGITTSIGGFLEAGSIATAAQAGARFRFQLVWPIALGTICLIFLVEQSGRFAAVSKHTVAGAMRERFGYPLFLVPFVGMMLVSFLVLASELGGVALAIQLATGIAFPWWGLPVGVLAWLLIWRGTFGLIEKGTSLLGLITIAFAIAAVRLHPQWSQVIHGVVPTAPSHDTPQYWLIAVSIMGASISPYLLYFYSAGAVEDRWDDSHIPINRVIATIGMTFGGTLSMAVLVVSAMVLMPRGIRVEQFTDMASMLTPVFGRWGLTLFILSLGIACFGAALEVALSMAYLAAQGFGWHWGEDVRPREASRFALVYTVAILLGALLVTTGIEPLKLTMISMALTALVLPFGIIPFLVIMNDERYVREHGNRVVSNVIIGATVVIAFVLAIVSIPLVVAGGG